MISHLLAEVAVVLVVLTQVVLVVEVDTLVAVVQVLQHKVEMAVQVELHPLGQVEAVEAVAVRQVMVKLLLTIKLQEMVQMV